MFRTIVLTFAFLLLAQNPPTDKPFTMTSITKKEQVAKVITNLFSAHPDVAAQASQIADWTTVRKMMKVDLNKVNALKNKDGRELSTVLDAAKLEVLQYGISYINHLQIEHGEMLNNGLFDINVITAADFQNFMDAEEEHVYYTTEVARRRKEEKDRADAMVKEQAARQQLLQAQIQAAQQAQSNATGLGAGSGGNSGSFLRPSAIS